MSKKNDKYLKINGHVVRLPKKGLNNKSAQKVANGLLDARENGLIEEKHEAARKEYAELLKEGWKKTSIFRSYF